MAGGLETFMSDALRSLASKPPTTTSAADGLSTPPRLQHSNDAQTGSRFLSWMQQTGDPESIPERPVSGFDESSFVLSIEDLIGEQSTFKQRQQPAPLPIKPMMQHHVHQQPHMPTTPQQPQQPTTKQQPQQHKP